MQCLMHGVNEKLNISYGILMNSLIRVADKNDIISKEL